MINTNHSKRRAGFTMIEIIVALGILAVATTLAVQLIRVIRKTDAAADDRFRRTMAVENAGEQLRHTDLEELPKQTQNIQDRWQVTIDQEPFQSGEQTGIHLIVTSDAGGDPIVHHVWKGEPIE